MNGKQECEELMNQLLPFAEDLLRRYGEFYPYGGYMKADGTIVDIGASDGKHRPQSTDLIHMLQTSLQEYARTKRCKAVAIIFDVVVTLPGTSCKSDAVQVSLDHTDGFSAEVFLPYQIANNKIIYGATFAQPGKHQVFRERSAEDKSS